MKALHVVVMLSSTVLAAIGQILFRVGAKGREQPLDFINAAVIAGIACYGLSTVLWIWSLSRAPLIYVYPFTMLTFVFVYLGSAALLGEHLPLRAMLGLALMMGGLVIVASANTAIE